MMTSRLIRTLGAAAVLVVTLAAPAMAEVVNGTDGSDKLVGTAQADTIRGQGGADELYGRRGADRLFAGQDSKPDQLFGGPGPDRIIGRDVDVVHAASGNDTIVLTYPGPVLIRCGPGEDRVTLRDATMRIYGLQTSRCERVVLCPRGGECHLW